jgi:hypothetical protein
MTTKPSKVILNKSGELGHRIDGDLWDFGIRVSPTKKDRICSRYVELGEGGFDFHELVWERNMRGRWRRHKTITAQAFCRDATQWIVALHSFDASEGKAIVKVGASAETKHKGLVGYSWRSLNLLTPEEPVVLQKCTEPFEPYAG